MLELIMIRDVTDLEVYNNALKNLRLAYKLAGQIPDSRPKFKKQVTNAGESIAPNIAEGFAKKRSEKEFKRFLGIAMGSSDEVITHARQAKILAERFKRIDIELCDKIIEEYKIESKQLQQLIKNWKNYY